MKILMVEDDPMIIEMYKMRLEVEGYEVVQTEKGSEALTIAQTQKPDLILLDVVLPEVDGFSILQSLKNNYETRDIPVLLLTNLGQESDQEHGLEMGAADYFIKAQHTPTEVIQKINSLINNKY